MTVTTARQRVLNQLIKLGSASTRGLARTLRVSEPSVRHHLRVLVSEGRVEVRDSPPQDGHRGGGGRGRPEKIFCPSAARMGNNLAGLVEALLLIEGSMLKIENLAKYILNTDQFANLPISKRLTLLVEKLNERHYQARWEAGAEGPRFIFGRCPYAAVIEGHPELCQMDASVLGNALGREVSQLGRIQKGQSVCVFGVR